MTRSPLAYPLNRSADMDAGGAADLQTDIMRFMAILSLCLVAIFALVQSIPLNPVEPADPEQAVGPTALAEPVVEEQKVAAVQVTEPQVTAAVQKPIDAQVALTRPKWVPKYAPRVETAASLPKEQPAPRTNPVVDQSLPAEPVTQTVESEARGFTLRFESDAALTRLVASNRIGVYAIAEDRAQRMTVSDSRISFWDASTPNIYHEMETVTVPAAVIDALARGGADANSVRWGVTLPVQLKSKLDELMLKHENGALVIVSSGDIQWEAS
ncbi:MAG: hypothetical protein WBN07_03970 [Woeseiaceae bacterium]